MHTSKRHDDRTRERIPNKTQKSLEHILADAENARNAMSLIACWTKQAKSDAKRKNDAAMIERIGDLSTLVTELALTVANLERLAADAQQGRYREPDLRNTEKNGVLP